MVPLWDPVGEKKAQSIERVTTVSTLQLGEIFLSISFPYQTCRIQYSERMCLSVVTTWKETVPLSEAGPRVVFWQTLPERLRPVF